MLGSLLLGACPDKRSKKRRPRATQPTRAAHPPRNDSPLAAWLQQVPADARWAVASADLGRLQAVLSDVAALLAHHPKFAPTLRHWRARLERQWGGWPLTPETWAKLSLQHAGGGALYQRADGVTVLGFRTAQLGKVVETINQAIRDRGARQAPRAKQLQVAGQPVYRLDRWTCATRGERSWCADVPPARFAAVTAAPPKNLWQQTLGWVPGEYLRQRLGIWLSPRAGFAHPLHRAAGTLLGQAPRGLWLAASLGRRLRLQVLALTAPQAAPPAAATTLGKPGQSGLAAATAAPLVIRLRLSPRRLGDQLARLLPALRPALDLVRKKRVRGDTLAEEMLNGEVVLLGDPAGVGVILGLRSRSGGQRAMKRLMLLLGPHVAKWQSRVRGRGRGWDLSFTHANLGDVPIHRLILRVPKNAGPGAPKLINGHLTLQWGLAQRHLVVATEPNLFRRILAAVDQPDSRFLHQLSNAPSRRRFREHYAVSAHARLDDPLTALPKAQRAVARNWLGELGPDSQRWATGIRTLLDLTDSLTLSCEELPAGVGCQLQISLLTAPGATAPAKATPDARPRPPPGPGPGPRVLPGLTLNATYREALINKWGGNRDGHLTLLRSLATSPTASPTRAKASRVLALRGAGPHRGPEGLFLSVWLPWARHRHVTIARREAPRELDRLARALQKLAHEARRLPAAARRRWARGLHSTRITPTRSCCKGGIRRCESRATDWSHPTWRRLGFALSGPHRYRYQLTLEPGSLHQRIMLRALGDLDCNGRSSLLQRVGIIDLSTGALKIGALTRVRADN